MTERHLAIVDDHQLIAEALGVAFRDEGFVADVVPVGEEDDEVVAAIEELGPDLVLLDVHLGPHRLGIPLIPRLVAAGVCVVVVTATRDPVLLADCIAAGASGLIDKAQPFAELADMVRSAAEGAAVLSVSMQAALVEQASAQRRVQHERQAPFRSLTPRECEVLGCLLAGSAAEAIAEATGTSLATARTHIRSILSKLGVNTQLAAVAAAHRAEWRPPAPA